jgi:diguanylate cyclase (GGDEF)-like protein
MLVVMSIDLDSFKRVNEAHSHYVGDKVLQMVAERLQVSVRAADTVCRKEDDQFLLLLEELSDPRAAESVARKLIDRVSQPIEIEGLHLSVSASIGIAVYPQDGETGETLINNAESAISEAKRNPDRCAYFNPRYH